MERCRFPFHVRFDDAVFEELADFRGVRFLAGVSFQNATFKQNATFNRSQCDGTLNFYGATFRGHAHFIGLIVPSGIVSFEGIEVAGEFRIGDSQIQQLLNLSEATFNSVFDCTDAKFHGIVNMESTVFYGDASFLRTEFNGPARFGEVAFEAKAGFKRTSFEVAPTYVSTKFLGITDFDSAVFERGADFIFTQFDWTNFHGSVSKGALDFYRCIMRGDIHLGVTLDELGLLRLTECGTDFATDSSGRQLPREAIQADYRPSGSPSIYLSHVDLSRAFLRSLSPDGLRFKDVENLEQLKMNNVAFSRRKVADEVDLDSLPEGDGSRPTASEVEGVYRGLRRNHEGRGDLVGSHVWYVAEMEVGRRFASKWGLRWFARSFYKWTSDYGLSALRPIAILLASFLLGTLLLSCLPEGGCAVRVEPNQDSYCVDIWTSARTTILALFFQDPPSGVELSGIGSDAIWLLLRVTGAGMLVAMAVAFRNQVARR